MFGGWRRSKWQVQDHDIMAVERLAVDRSSAEQRLAADPSAAEQRLAVNRLSSFGWAKITNLYVSSYPHGRHLAIELASFSFVLVATSDVQMPCTIWNMTSRIAISRWKIPHRCNLYGKSSWRKSAAYVTPSSRTHLELLRYIHAAEREKRRRTFISMAACKAVVVLTLNNLLQPQTVEVIHLLCTH